MNDYELMYILHPRLTAQEVEETTQRIAGLITNAGGEIVSVDPWGRRRLAYPIDRNLEGSYVLMTFNAEPSTGPALEAQLNLSEDVLRHLLIRGIIPYDGPPRDERPSDRGMQERPPRSAAPAPPDAGPPAVAEDVAPAVSSAGGPEADEPVSAE